MSFFIKDDKTWEKYKQIGDVIENKLGIKKQKCYKGITKILKS